MIFGQGIYSLPSELVERASGDVDFAGRLLHVETRAEALREVGLERNYELDSRLDEIATMSLREAMVNLRTQERIQP